MVVGGSVEKYRSTAVRGSLVFVPGKIYAGVPMIDRDKLFISAYW